MKLFSRRDFLKLSAFTIAGLTLHTRLPIYGVNKTFTPFKFAFVPDLHLSTQRSESWVLLNESLIVLQDTLKLLEGMNLDFVVFGGDLIDNESKDYKDLPLLLDLLYTYEKPYYVLFGDREARLNNDLSKEDFAHEFRRNGFIQRGKTYWAQQPVCGVDLIGLDSSVINQKDGEISPNQSIWLSDQLKQNPNNMKIIALHHPLIPDNPLNSFYSANGFKLNNTSAILDIIDRANHVDIVLSGHHHLNLITSRNNVHYVNSPSIVTYPCEFRVIEVSGSSIDIYNVSITYKQMIKKAYNSLLASSYVKEFDNMKPKAIAKLHKGDKSSRELKIKY